MLPSPLPVVLIKDLFSKHHRNFNCLCVELPPHLSSFKQLSQKLHEWDSSTTHVEIDVLIWSLHPTECILWFLNFCIFGDYFYVSGTQDAEVTKSLKLCYMTLWCRILIFITWFLFTGNLILGVLILKQQFDFYWSEVQIPMHHHFQCLYFSLLSKLLTLLP